MLLADATYRQVNAASSQPLAAGARIRYQESLSGICGGKSGSGTDLPPNTQVLPCHNRSINGPTLIL